MIKKCYLNEAPRQKGGASRKGNFINIVPLDPAYKTGLRGTCRSQALSVKPMFLNISLHLGWDQILHRIPLFNQLPDPGRGDIEKRNFFEIEPIA